MKIEWLVPDVTLVGSLDRAERDNFGMILDVFWPIGVLVWEQLCDVGIPS